MIVLAVVLVAGLLLWLCWHETRLNDIEAALIDCADGIDDVETS